jgi:hypothetical protein
MKVGVPRETLPGEHRVALVPDVLPKLKAAGIDVLQALRLDRSRFWFESVFPFQELLAGRGVKREDQEIEIVFREILRH